ncbi:MAG: extracellular solute-binding protein [Anaerolineae bacterium]|jgi:multiple sugar transport system substrate-binding protein|nr:extracellular solute-binding protein [Anaerolineae bacterium]
MENRPKLSRRDFLRGAALAGVGATIAACAPSAPPAPAAAPKAEPTKAAAAAAAPTAAPAAAQEAKIRFISNHGEADVPLFKKVLENFAAKNPNIKVEYLDIAGNEFYNSINTQGAGGQLPDVWYTRTFDVPVYGSKGWTTSLQPLIDRDAKEVNVDDFWPAQVAQMKWKGQLYALPYDFSNIGIYYNKKMFDDAKVPYPTNEGWKWDELMQLAQKFVKKDGNQFKTWGLDMYLWNWVFHGNMFGWGGKIWSDDFKTSVVNSKENLDCFKWFIDARKKGLYPEAGAMPQGVNPFGGGLVPMAYQGSWATVALRDVIKDKFDFDVVAMPKSPTGASCLNAAGGAWGIAKNTKALEAAWTFNKFLTNTDSTNVLISDPLRSIPGRKSSVPRWNETAAKGGMPPKNVAVFGKQMPEAAGAPYPPYWQDYGTAWNNMIVPLLSGPSDADPAKVLADFDAELKRIIDQNKASLS